MINTVTVILDHLPPDAFYSSSPLSPNLQSSLAGEGTGFVSPLNGEEAQRNNIIQEILETERNYVHDLEAMRVCIYSFIALLYKSPFVFRIILKRYLVPISSIRTRFTPSFQISTKSLTFNTDFSFGLKAQQNYRGGTSDGGYILSNA